MTDLATLLPQFVSVPAGAFLMGTPEGDLSDLARRYGGTRESYREESPQHRVQLPAYAIAATPVTNALYAAFASARGERPPGGPADYPVVDVSWHDATAFCAWVSGGDTPRRPPFRLPTEAEWERAARGEDGRVFPWGDGFAPDLANTREGERAGRSPVGSYPEGASPCGALDMAGNVWEWTASLDTPYPYAPANTREGQQADGRRILRGGCYANPQGFARCACRFRLAPQVRNSFIGFRLAYSLRQDFRL